MSSVDILRAIEAVEAALADFQKHRTAIATQPLAVKSYSAMRDAALRLAVSLTDAPALLAAAKESSEKDAEIERLRGMLDELYDTNPCSFDHHGYCQEHGWLQEGTCIMARVKEELGLEGQS